jgi:hypothetical protein
MPLARRSATFATLLALVGTLALPAPADAQAPKLRDRLGALFTFGSCGEPLCLDLDNLHGSHYVPGIAQGNSTVIAVVNQALSKSTSNLPIGATSSGATYSIVNGLPVRTSTSAGPIFAERSQTLGRGRFFLSASVTNISFSTLNGVPLDNLQLNFAHQDVGNPGLGDPEFENDIVRINLALKLDLLVAALSATYGVSDHIDIGVAVPFVRASMAGTSVAQIDPFGPNPLHFFGGTSADPILRAAASVNATAAGLGDVVGRVKVNVAQGTRYGAAVLGEVRIASGDEENLLGAGSASGRAIAVGAAQFGDFSLHGNAGYLIRTGDFQNDAMLATLGFDNLMAPWATLAVSLISEWRVGAEKIELPAPIQILFPFERTIPSTSIPSRREDRLEASVGMKFSLRGGTVLMLNGSAPLRRAGLQPDFVWTTGMEFSF